MPRNWGGDLPTPDIDGFETAIRSWLNTVQSSATDLDTEVEDARAGEPDLSTRINAVAATVGSLWSAISNSSRTSEFVFTVANTDATELLIADTPIRVTKADTSFQYGYVTGSVFGGVDTVVTVDFSIDVTATAFSNSNIISEQVPRGAGVQGGISDTNGNEMLDFNATGSAVNHFAFTNAATGTSPLLQAAGDDTNIDLRLFGKGSGVVRIGATGSYFNASGNLVVAGDLAVDGTTFNVDTSNNRVGILNSSPQTDVHIGSGSGTPAMRFDAGNSQGIQIQLWHNGSQTGFLNSNQTNIFSVYDSSNNEIFYVTNSELTLYEPSNDGNPLLCVGATSAERGCMNAVYDTGTQTLLRMNMTTATDSATADYGSWYFFVDGDETLHINDNGLNLTTGHQYYINSVSVLNATTLGSAIVTSSLTTVGALNSGSITSGFGSINIGSSTFTTTGSGSIGTLVINAASIGSCLFEVEDGGTGNTTLLKVTQDDENTVGIVVGNDTASTNDTEGTALSCLNNGNGVVQARGAGNDLYFRGGSGNNVGVIDGTNDRFGINQDSPQVMLHVGNASSTPYARFDAANASGIQLQLWHNGSQTGFINSNQTYPISLYAGTSTEALRVDTSGIVSLPEVYGHDMNGETYRDLLINNSGELGYDSSTLRKKTNVVGMEDTSWVYGLAPVNFEYKKKNDAGAYLDSGTGVKEYGLIAEDVERINPSFVFYDSNGIVEGVHYKKLIPVLLNELIRLKKQIEERA